MSKNHLMIIDGMALLFRAYYATAINNYFMINSKGIPTNAIYGFVKHFLTAKETFNPSHIIVCWDLEGGSYRSEIYPEYKANRSEAPSELIPQFSLVKDVVSSFDVPNIGVKGYEADDCIGTIVKELSSDNNITVVTGDKDLLQLVNNRTSVAILKNGIGNYNIFTKEKFIETYGILPSQFSEVKAFMGDASDNYSGVKGIGEKTALKLIKEFQSVQGVLGNLANVSKSIKTKIENDLDSLLISLKLAEINCEVPLKIDLEHLKVQINKNKAYKMLEELEFKGLDKIIS
ncbi:5'-3' exonuclease [Bacillus luteolus]|uniref:5'-3' exonuclease n=1 Tax=Litchfieldia luteola TaxID=682179 RepID=A0ABR9QNX3_9BACI|nr:5'-3' exonuclease H3TH domain-containing protein [Cytobacillus luteolus]MBE4910192.1 5'-3' exonuclease [Cytobacillus luteolus]MBP1942239.1 5'-3' exonuclease [Cytobacillus luteolus]